MRFRHAPGKVDAPDGASAAVPEYALIIIVSLVPIVALALALACGATRLADRAGMGTGVEPVAEADGGSDEALS
jgi:hypothetical protein